METTGDRVSLMDRIALQSVRVAQPRVIGARQSGERVLSAIAKQPVAADELYLTELNLAGDRQADLTVHGGPDKAVYVYPAEHLPRWNEELGTSFDAGIFGENLTVAGTDERNVRVGDIWSWGEALLQVSQPRSPCYKLAMITGQPTVGRHMAESGRTGWYLRVLRPGTVPVVGPIRVVERHLAGVTVLDAHRASLPGASFAEIERVLAVEPLAGMWRAALEDRPRRSSSAGSPVL